MKLLFCLIVLVILSLSLSDSVDDKLWLEKKTISNEVASNVIGYVHVLRLSPNEDLLDSLFKYARAVNITAATVLSVVGSLKTTNIRYANQEEGESLTGHFEIVSLVGTLDLQSGGDSGHIHISCANEAGVTVGGHLLIGNIVYTTAEITLLAMPHILFTRQPDDVPGGSGYDELKIYHI